MVMQMGSSSGQVFYINENSGIQNTSKDSCASSNGIGQVVLSPVSPVQTSLNILKNNGNSPNDIASVPTVNIATDSKSGSARSLSELFNVQSLSGVSSHGGVIQRNIAITKSATVNVQSNGVANNLGNIPVSQSSCANNQPGSQSSAEIANLLSSLKAAGVQFVENNSTASVPVLSANEQNDKKITVNSIIQTLKASGVNVVENTCSQPVEENSFVPEKKIVGGVPVNNMYRIVDGSGNLTLFTTGGGEQAKDSGSDQYIMNETSLTAQEVKRYLKERLS